VRCCAFFVYKFFCFVFLFWWGKQFQPSCVFIFVNTFILLGNAEIKL
jgi:hypothetical protein